MNKRLKNQSFRMAAGGIAFKKVWDQHGKSAITKFRKYCIGQSKQNVTVLVSAASYIFFFFLVALSVLCFGFSLSTMLVTR